MWLSRGTGVPGTALTAVASAAGPHLDLYGGTATKGGVVPGADSAVPVRRRACTTGGPAEAARVRRARVGAPEVRLRGERARGRRARHARGAIPPRRDQRPEAEWTTHQLREGGRGERQSGGGRGRRSGDEGTEGALVREGEVSVEEVVGQLQVICGEEIAKLCCGTVTLSVQIGDKDMPVRGKRCLDSGGYTAVIGEPHVIGRIMRAIFRAWFCGRRAGSIGVDLCAVEKTYDHVRQTQGIIGLTAAWQGNLLWEGGILPIKR